MEEEERMKEEKRILEEVVKEVLSEVIGRAVKEWVEKIETEGKLS